ncbi:MAG: hypothetical protein H5U13_01835 [Parvibaculum sp.]|nr:hypothetical protein [Parvibaculum sp.]
MPEELDISLAPELLDEGSPEERAAFGLFTIRSRHSSLTEGFDFYLNNYRPGPLVSGYHAAEWFAWNWWRLRWEPRSAAHDWALAHQMTSIGEGYVWPNVTIFSDGVRTALISSPSSRPDAKPFRYIGALPLILPSTVFEAAIDAFIPRVLGRLREQDVPETNLDRLWCDVLAERADPDIAKRRRLEALLGRDPDAVGDNAVEQLLADVGLLGEQSLYEIAAEAARGTAVLTAKEFKQIAQEHGHDAEPQDVVRLHADHRVARGPELPAWRIGADAARALREQEGLGAGAITNSVLARMAGTREATLGVTQTGRPPFSFVLDQNARKARIVLRSPWPTGQRFDLARLIGDQLISTDGALHPATRAYTYRQKAQRSFAAEFLSPFEAVDEMLAGDYSTERQQEVAESFDVSPMTIDTLLKNHGKIEREGSDFEFVTGS